MPSLKFDSISWLLVFTKAEKIAFANVAEPTSRIEFNLLIFCEIFEKIRKTGI